MKKYMTRSLVILSAGWLIGSGCAESSSMEPPALASLTIDPAGDLLPEFSNSVTTYSATVPTDVNSVVVEANAEDEMTTIAINGMVTPSGAKQSVALLPFGMDTPIEVVASSPSGQSTTYTVMVSRLASREVSLALLRVTQGALQPAFDASINYYTLNLNHDVDNVTISATKTDAKAILSGVLTADIGTAAAEASFTLPQVGTTIYASITVTASNGSYRTYSVQINRLLRDGTPPPIGGPPSDVSTLSGLAVSGAGLSPLFSPATTTYSGTYSNCNPGLQTLTATKADKNAVMKLPGKVVPAGVPSGVVNVFEATPIEIVVTSPDQEHMTTYRVTVYHRPYETCR